MGWRRYCGFVLLVWSQGFQHVRPSHQPCSAPELNGGFLVPELKSYDHEAQLHYGCDNGRKPAVEGWWATSSCLNGAWSPEPQCVDENACIKPEIHNVKKASDWVPGKTKIRITCADGYDLKDHAATTECTNGTWSPVLLCEKSINSCGEPPQIPHAVIIHRGYKDFFPDNTRLQYECEKGFSVEGEDSIYCMAGNWTEGPTCTDGGKSTSTGTDTHPEGPTTPDDGGRRAVTGVTNCGEPPTVHNGDVVENGAMFLKYQCVNYYELVGPEKVVCYSNGLWSRVPICQDNFCSVDTDRDPKFISVGVQFVGNGKKLRLRCAEKGYFDQYSDGVCTNGRISFSVCCNQWKLNNGWC
ncbi:complement factor H-like isoform X1 [Pungitius pungitius]|uniref:complement factor H-like isoform X1 n=1 Tax=Pungitius pungitius TaxID=134920 RepID=UPI002E157559